MYISPINIAQNTATLKNNKSLKNNNQSFTGNINPEVAYNKMKMFAIQDIWGDMPVRLPKTQEEKKAILEVLPLVKDLKKLSGLYAQRASLYSKMRSLVQKSEKGENIDELLDYFTKYGKPSVLSDTLDKKIALEEAKKSKQLAELKEIYAKEDEYNAKKLIRSSEYGKEYKDRVNNNINKDGKSIQDLIDIIKEYEPVEVKSVSKATVKKVQTFDKKTIIKGFRDELEDAYRKRLNVYVDSPDEKLQALKIAAQEVVENNKEVFIKHPELQKDFKKMGNELNKEVNSQINHLAQYEGHRLGNLIIDMGKKEDQIIKLTDELNRMSERLKKKPTEDLKNLYADTEFKLLELRSDWKEELDILIKCEEENNKSMHNISKDIGDIYDYLMEKNPTLLKYKKVKNMIDDNDGKVPMDFKTLFD